MTVIPALYLGSEMVCCFFFSMLGCAVANRTQYSTKIYSFRISNNVLLSQVLTVSVMVVKDRNLPTYRNASRRVRK